jgi:urease accessory protein
VHLDTIVTPFSLERSPKTSSWEAHLHLAIEKQGPRATLTRRRHVGPLVVQKPFYPEGDACAHLVIIHPPGGIASGDKLEIQVYVGKLAHALITTPGAAKWYRCPSSSAEQRIQLHVDGTLEWLPQETILFNESRAQLFADINLSKDAVYAGWDIVCFGRSASGETYREGSLEQRIRINRDDKAIWFEASRLRGNDPLLNSPIGLAGFPICGSFVVAAPELKRVPVAELREIFSGSVSRSGITVLPHALIARYLGHSAEEAKAYFIKLWTILRPVLIGRKACLPRIWRT